MRFRRRIFERGAMYTSTAAQHLVSQSAHLLPHSSLKAFASKASSVPATLKPRLPGNNALTHTTSTSVSQFFSPSTSHSRVQWKRNLPPSRALGYNEANDNDDDDVYVKSFRQARGSPPQRNDPVEKFSPRMTARRRYNDSRDSTSRQSDQLGFKPGFNDERPFEQSRGGRGGRDMFPRAERVEREDVVASTTRGGASRGSIL